MLLLKTWSLLNVLFLKHLQNRDYIYRSTNASPEGKAYNWVGQNCVTVLSDYRACLKISSQNKRQAVASGVDVNKWDTHCSMATPFDCLRRELSLVRKKFKNNCSVVNTVLISQVIVEITQATCCWRRSPDLQGVDVALFGLKRVPQKLLEFFLLFIQLN